MAANLNKIIVPVSCGPGKSMIDSLFKGVERKICFDIKPLFNPNVSILTFHLKIRFYENLHNDFFDLF